MNAGRLDLDGVDALRAALSDAAIVARYESKIVTVPDADCMFWSGAVSGRGHGRFWLGDERVVIAHRFGFALACGVDALVGIEVLGHRCDNPSEGGNKKFWFGAKGRNVFFTANPGNADSSDGSRRRPGSRSNRP